MKDRKKTILILGGGIMQLPAIRCAREMGLRIIVSDANPKVPGAALADVFEPVDLKDKDAMLECAAAHHNGPGLDGVFTAGTDFSTTVAWVAEHLGLPGISYETALKASDKALMRQAFREAGVPIPGFVSLSEQDKPSKVLETLRLPLVLKPVDNMGARGIRRVDTPAELEAAFPEALAFSRSRKVIAEEYMAGEEFSLDALVDGDDIVLCGFADRHIYFEPFFIELGHTMPSRQSREVQDEVFRVFCQGIRALGIDRGAAKGDMKLDPQRGVMVGEIAARLSGGFMSGWTYPYASGVNPARGGINLALGLPMGDMSPQWQDVSAERAFISLPGEVAEIRGFEEGEKIPGIEFSHLRAEPDGRVLFPRNNVEKCGNFISRAAGRPEAVFAAEEACRKVEIRLKPSDKETRDFLTGKTYPWVPWAYHLDDPENRGFFSGLGGGTGRADGECIKLPALPRPEKEISRDWLGLEFGRGLDRVFRLSAPLEWTQEDDYQLGNVFWRAYLRGGWQGAVWIIDTWREVLSRGEAEKFLSEWQTV